jgi:hypothetical protein
MEIRRPNLNLQDKYVMMNGQIIERSKYRAPNPSRAEQYAALLEAHKTSRYMRNENPLEDPYVTRRLDQTAKINDYLQKANVTKVKAEIIKNITEISNKHIALSKSIAQGQKDVANNIKREIIELGRESQGLARTIAAPDRNGRVNLENLFSMPDWDETPEGMAEYQALIEELRQSGKDFNEPLLLGENDYEEMPAFDYQPLPQPEETQPQADDEEPAPPPEEEYGYEPAPPPEDVQPQAEEAAPPIVNNGDPAVDSNVSDVLPVLEEELSNLQTIGEFNNMPVADRLQKFRDAQQASEGVVNEKEMEPEADEEPEDDEELDAKDRPLVSIDGLDYVDALSRLQSSTDSEFNELNDFANRVAAAVPAIAYAGVVMLDPLEIASRIIHYGKPKFFRIKAGNRISLADLVERLNEWDISYARFDKMDGIRYSQFSIGRSALGADVFRTRIGDLDKKAALEKTIYYAITFDESNLVSDGSSIASTTSSTRSIKVVNALKAAPGSADELVSNSFALDLFKAVLNPKYKGVAALLTERVNPAMAPVSTPQSQDAPSGVRKSARLQQQKRNETEIEADD